MRSVAERCILHLMLLYLGTDLASQISKSMKEVDGNGLVEYCKRTIAKGPDAIISSDTEE